VPAGLDTHTLSPILTQSNNIGVTDVSTSDFLERLQSGPLLCDGAMGTELYRKGRVSFDQCLDELNLDRADLVRSIHQDYIRAGADIIETNTFGANRIKLEAHNLDHQLDMINRNGVILAQQARKASGSKAWIAGAVGPIGKPLAPLGPVSLHTVRKVFTEQIAILEDAGADILILETFSTIAELTEAILAARAVCQLPVIAQITLTEEGRSPDNYSPEEIVQTLTSVGADVIGLNCSVGSQIILDGIKRMASISMKWLSAQPNAGFSTYVGGRFVYRSPSDYMASQAKLMVESGATIVGGCCGTTPEHISKMREMIATIDQSVTVTPSRQFPLLTPTISAPETPDISPTRLQDKLKSGFAVTVEVVPPKGFGTAVTIQNIDRLNGTGMVDAVNIPDSPRASGRLSALVLSSIVRSATSVEPILHLATRHRNLVALHSEILGAQAMDVRNIFVIMGDLPHIGDYPDATAVSDITATGLIHLMTQFNNGRDLASRVMEGQTSFHIGCAFNMSAQDPEREFKILERKVRSGAHFILTQPVYDPKIIEYWSDRLGEVPIPILMGLLPLRSFRHAEFLHNEVPGIVIPSGIRSKLQKAGKNARGVGLDLAKEMLEICYENFSGVYLLPSSDNFEAIFQLLEHLKVLNVHQHRSGVDGQTVRG